MILTEQLIHLMKASTKTLLSSTDPAQLDQLFCESLEQFDRSIEILKEQRCLLEKKRLECRAIDFFSRYPNADIMTLEEVLKTKDTELYSYLIKKHDMKMIQCASSLNGMKSSLTNAEQNLIYLRECELTLSAYSCKFCKMIGHTVNACQTLKNTQCHLCNNFGHRSKHCRSNESESSSSDSLLRSRSHSSRNVLPPFSPSSATFH